MRSRPAHHDYKLHAYTVGDLGESIVLDLVYEYAGRPRDTSKILFWGVRFHHFIHLGGAIIIDISETSLRAAVDQHDLKISALNAQYGGLPYLEDDDSSLIRKIEEDGYRTWLISSAIGFFGFVVCRKVTSQKPDQ